MLTRNGATHPSTIKTTALALCYSTAEYACPVWERSAHAHKVDPVLNDACRAITGCLLPTNVENLYLLAGIAPPAVRRSVTAQREREKQVNDNRHPLHGHNLPRKRLKSRNSFMHATYKLIQSPSTRRLEQWSVVVVYPLPWPLLVGGVRYSRLWSTSQLLRPSGQQCSHSVGVCPQIQGRQCGAYVGAVEEMMCVVCVDVTEGA